MLTSYQVETGAYYSTEGGELYCVDHVDGLLLAEVSIKPLSRYELDEEQTARVDGYDPEDLWGDAEEAAKHTDSCLPALYCDQCGTELVDEYHDLDCKAEQDDEPNPLAQVWKRDERRTS